MSGEARELDEMTRKAMVSNILRDGVEIHADTLSQWVKEELDRIKVQATKEMIEKMRERLHCQFAATEIPPEGKEKRQDARVTPSAPLTYIELTKAYTENFRLIEELRGLNSRLVDEVQVRERSVLELEIKRKADRALYSKEIEEWKSKVVALEKQIEELYKQGVEKQVEAFQANPEDYAIVTPPSEVTKRWTEEWESATAPGQRMEILKNLVRRVGKPVVTTHAVKDFVLDLPTGAQIYLSLPLTSREDKAPAVNEVLKEVSTSSRINPFGVPYSLTELSARERSKHLSFDGWSIHTPCPWRHVEPGQVFAWQSTDDREHAEARVRQGLFANPLIQFGVVKGTRTGTAEMPNGQKQTDVSFADAADGILSVRSDGLVFSNYGQPGRTPTIIGNCVSRGPSIEAW